MNQKVKEMVGMAFFVALLYISSFELFKITIGPVPISLQTLVLLIIASLLPVKKLMMVIVVYLLMVSNKVVGPTGGYLIAFIPAGQIVSSIGSKELPLRFAVNFVASLLILVIGFIWLKFMLGITFEKAFMIGVLPFIMGDLIKSLVAAYVSPRFQLSHLKI